MVHIWLVKTIGSTIPNFTINKVVETKINHQPMGVLWLFYWKILEIWIRVWIIQTIVYGHGKTCVFAHLPPGKLLEIWKLHNVLMRIVYKFWTFHVQQDRCYPRDCWEPHFVKEVACSKPQWSHGKFIKTTMPLFFGRILHDWTLKNAPVIPRTIHPKIFRGYCTALKSANQSLEPNGIPMGYQKDGKRFFKAPKMKLPFGDGF